MAVRFFDETVIHRQSEDDAGVPVTHMLIETGVSPTHKPVRLATDEDKAHHADEFRAYERAKRPSKPCEHCDGTGSVVDEEAERAMAKEEVPKEPEPVVDAPPPVTAQPTPVSIPVTGTVSGTVVGSVSPAKPVEA